MLNKSFKHVTCETCQVRKNSLFSQFCGDDVEHLDAHKACSAYKKNQSLFLEGSFPRGVFCINQGKVKVYSRGDSGKEQIIQVLSGGDIVGFKAMFSGDPYNVSAETLEESNVCFIGKEDFLDMMDTNPTLRNGVMRELSKELSQRTEMITSMAQKSVRERVACSVAILNDVYEQGEINLTREDLANFVGTATETVIRLLKELKDEKVLEINGRKLKVLNKESLFRIAGLH